MNSVELNGVQESVKPTKVTITKGESDTIRVGQKLTLKTKLTPATATTTLTWKSSNTKVATVSSKGVVTAKKVGKTKITVKTKNGKKASIKITVRALTKKEIRALYKKKAPTLDEGMEETRIKFLDMTGDGIEEAMVTYEHYDPVYGGAYVLTCVNGKVKTILDGAGGYGMDSIYLYRSTRTVLVHCGGRGYEYYDVFSFKNGVFKRIASKTRDESIAYGGDYNSKWGYWDSRDSKISKAKYDALTKKLFKGKKTRLY